MERSCPNCKSWVHVHQCTGVGLGSSGIWGFFGKLHNLLGANYNVKINKGTVKVVSPNGVGLWRSFIGHTQDTCITWSGHVYITIKLTFMIFHVRIWDCNLDLQRFPSSVATFVYLKVSSHERCPSLAVSLKHDSEKVSPDQTEYSHRSVCQRQVFTVAFSVEVMTSTAIRLSTW